MKKGFTLAELLITIGITGVLAALVLPTLYRNINTTLLGRAKKVQQRKIAQAITMLSVRSNRLAYPTTAAFVNELQRYLQIAKSCGSNNIADCWPYEQVTLNDDSNTVYNISDAKDKSVFWMQNIDPEGNVADYAGDNVAFVTSDGAHVLINFNRLCNPNVANWNRTCYVALVDVNGDKGPNKVGEDLNLINAVAFVSEPKCDDSETGGAAQVKRCNLNWDEDE